ncbi:hypothetical protein BCR44DRAFT_235215 [Catenaria anguillulae PL171]|uniref:Uncharacterized protein n=1 Tax=Catenaria anguillulae PL171 TaxID=765915 RepID=A0A1Y2H909_9FUNG|nr:hypothetical protein BCR44DRAFT_235215 [Catenaria anguillulae PL171]
MSPGRLHRGGALCSVGARGIGGPAICQAGQPRRSPRVTATPSRQPEGGSNGRTRWKGGGLWEQSSKGLTLKRISICDDKLNSDIIMRR